MRVLVFLSACLVAGCGSGATSTTVETPAAAEPTVPVQGEESKQHVWRDQERGFSVTYPDTWQRAPSSLTPYLSDPLELLAVATYELRPGGDRCSHQPVTAVEDLGPADALLVIFERAPPFTENGYPPRPSQPELSRDTNRFCVAGTRRSDSWFSFGESGRAFYALIAVGEAASEQTRAELNAIYESITLERR